MSRRRSGAELLPWMSANADNKEGRFLQLGNSLLLSKKFQSLSGSAKNAYQCMAMESGGKRDFMFPHAVALKKYGIPGTTLDRTLKELISNGFIQIIHQGSLHFPSIYSFCFDWKHILASPNRGIAHNK